MALVATYLGVFALVLGCGALYGLISHVVERRTNEIGVRLALGAQRGAVLRMVLGDALGLAAIGIAIGLALVVSLAGLARNLLFGITPTDPFALAGATALLMLVAVLAGYVPARRASQADPVAALRAD